ncbi:group II truncated hemoglobin [Longispora albida]|uniref:group II truncated hemoglobin n=1 Tax=Longispora albida TaxID=203523 RepID=UPI00037F6560|nr:antibiotic biosynthesis monooxygenase [Longispora albida]
MIVEYIRYQLGDRDAAEFEAAYGRAAAFLAAAPECEAYELSRSTDEPSAYVLRITWTSAEEHLSKFRGGPHFAGFFAEIRPYVEAIEEMRHYAVVTGVTGDGGAVPSLYQWAGGADALERLTGVFYASVGEDDLIGPLFASMNPAHPRYVAMWLGEVLGGPARYSEERGGHADMVGHHLGKGITEAQRRRWVGRMMDAADEAGLPDDPEFRASLVGYLEWGTRMAVIYSAPGAEGSVDAPMPRWRWAVPPYRG